jgi:hypothetical protein
VSIKANRTEYSRAKGLLSQCSTTLKKLDVCISTAEFREKDIDDGSLDGDQQVRWTSLREVGLELAIHTPNTEEFLDWVWMQCGQVKRLSVSTNNVHAVQNIVRGMLSHMPHLSEITLKGFGDAFDDDKFATLLSGSRTGWKRVKFLDGDDTLCASMGALVNHSATLEELTLDGCFIRGIDLIQVLRHCSPLQRMISTQTYQDDFTSRGIGANTFVDQDTDTGKLITWACEASLKYLQVTIVDIPRPGLRNSLIVETYPGQGREIQNQVYDRLARLINLETLWLGNQEYYETQYDCLEMSLESGLHKLSGLKSLKELGITGMKTRIGVREVRWMVEQWPRVRVIRGIGNRAKKWLQENRPLISV